MTKIPEKSPLPAEYEQKWQATWETQGVYKWQQGVARDKTFVVDTPPPTVSGSLHVGHVFSYTQTDVLARYKRMQGLNVFYPMGWDDNGLPTERRVQNVFGISCNPKLPYEASWSPEKTDPKGPLKEVSRQNFIEACDQLTQEDEAAFESMWRHLALSVDWQLQYATINTHCRLLSQRSFLDLVQKGYAYRKYAITMWDIDFQTAVAQAEIEDRIKPGTYYDIEFKVENSDQTFVIATTRPELLFACFSVVAHPDDARYKDLFGKNAVIPILGKKVPIMPADHADPEKGTGILMVCAFGDIHDVEFWKKHQDNPAFHLDTLALRLEMNGKMRVLDTTNQEILSRLNGQHVKKAKTIMADWLKETGHLKNETTTERAVKFYEKGDSPIEFMPTYQWFIKILDHKEALLAQGEKIQWHPEFMKTRYTNWVEGLNQDWCISRQRYFGVPFPVWYRLDANGVPDYDTPLFASSDQLPVDPLTQAPEGFSESQRNQPNGFMGDEDVMDTWATSSLTPQIASHWTVDEARHNSVFPMDIRPQSHEIIRTWAFYTIVKAWIHHQDIPWYHVLISGWVLDPDRKKMSKSKGNVVTPNALLDQYSADAVRYWAAKAKLGTDTAFEETVFQIGKKLTTKLLNAAKFVLTQLGDRQLSTSQITQPLDQLFVSLTVQVIEEATKAFESFDYALALEKTETHFWRFCDHYLELVKGRAYQLTGPQQESALATLEWVLSVFLRLLAPFVPYVTEEIWSWRWATQPASSIHRAAWPNAKEVSLPSASLEPNQAWEAIEFVLSDIRGAKTKAQKSMKHPVSSVTVEGPATLEGLVQSVAEDLKRAGSVEVLTFSQAQVLRCEVLLTDA